MNSEIIFFEFNKELNSSRQPVLSTGVTVQGDFFDPVDIAAPSAKLSCAGNFNYYIKFNYAYITAFDRYYFVTSTSVDGGTRINFEFSEDVLASFKSSLSSVNGYMLYCSDPYTETGETYGPDNNFSDSRVMPLRIESDQHFATSTKFVNNLGAGCFVITAASASLTAGVGIHPTPNQVVCTFSEFQNWYGQCQQCYQTNAVHSQNTTIPVTDFFTDVKWYPISKSEIVDKNELGEVITVNLIYSPYPGAPDGQTVPKTVSKVKTIHDWYFFMENVPHPQIQPPEWVDPEESEYVATFLNREPYTRRSLVMYPFGEVNLSDDCDYRYKGEVPRTDAGTNKYYTRVHVYLDCLTGAIMGVFETVYGYLDMQNEFHQDSTSLATESAVIAYASITYHLDLTAQHIPGGTMQQIISGGVSAIQGATSAVSSVVSAANGGSPIDAIGGVAGGLGQAANGVLSVVGAIQSRAGSTSVRSGGGTLAGLNLLPYIRSYFTIVSFPDYDAQGYPYFKIGGLRNYERVDESGHLITVGFNQMKDGDSAIGRADLQTGVELFNATSAERTAIIRYLEGGMHYE